MNATFQVQTIAKHHNGDVEVTLKQTYDHTTRQLNESTNPQGEINLQITDKTEFFKQGQKYQVNFRSMVPTSASVTLANGETPDPAEQAAWLKSHPNKTQADYVNYMNSVGKPSRENAIADGTNKNDPHRLDRMADDGATYDNGYQPSGNKFNPSDPKPFGQ